MPRPRAFDADTVIAGAVERFWSTSYALTSTDDLCLDSGLSRSSLYNAFGSKRELYLRSLRRYVDAKDAARASLLDSALSGRETIVAIGTVLIEEQWRDASRRACLGINACIEIGSADSEIAALLEANAASFDRTLALAIRRGGEDGSLRPHDDPDALARAIHAAFDGLQVRSRVSPDRDAVLRDLATLTGLL